MLTIIKEVVRRQNKQIVSKQRGDDKQTETAIIAPTIQLSSST